RLGDQPRVAGSLCQRDRVARLRRRTRKVTPDGRGERAVECDRRSQLGFVGPLRRGCPEQLARGGPTLLATPNRPESLQGSRPDPAVGKLLDQLLEEAPRTTGVAG